MLDKTTRSVVMALDRALRAFGGAPTYALTDNERTVSIDHVCGIAGRNPQIVSVARHYGLTIATCVPADPHSAHRAQLTPPSPVAPAHTLELLRPDASKGPRQAAASQASGHPRLASWFLFIATLVLIVGGLSHPA